MVLVTGGTGLVGAHLLFELSKKNEPIIALYRDEKRLHQVKKIFSYYHETPETLFTQITWKFGDITDISNLNDCFKGVKKVYHCAAMVSFDPKDNDKLIKTNVEGTANIVNCCIDHRVEKLCFVSSIAALGPSVKGEEVDEETPWGEQSTMYGITKHHAEMEIWRGTQEGVPAVIVNPGVIIAPGLWKNSSASFFLQASKAPRYFLPSGTGFVGINDVINAMTRLMESDVINERFILVNRNWTYEKFALLLAKGLQKAPPKKMVKPWMLALFWRYDWLRSNLFGKRRRLSKTVARLFETRETYKNGKIVARLDFSYENLEQLIERCCLIFLKEMG